jgi:hypothetical protein
MLLSSYHSSVVKVPLAPRNSPAPERGGYYHPALLLSRETQKPMQTNFVRIGPVTGSLSLSCLVYRWLVPLTNYLTAIIYRP